MWTGVSELGFCICEFYVSKLLQLSNHGFDTFHPCLLNPNKNEKMRFLALQIQLKRMTVAELLRAPLTICILNSSIGGV